MTDFAVRMHRNGGPEVLQYEAVEPCDPAAGEARVRQHAIGVNFIDIYYRTGLYPMPLPGGLGLEAAGVVEALTFSPCSRSAAAFSALSSLASCGT